VTKIVTKMIVTVVVVMLMTITEVVVMLMIIAFDNLWHYKTSDLE